MESKLYHYEIDEKRKISFVKLIDKLPDGYNLYEKSFGEGEIYYKAEGGRVTDVVFEGVSGRDYADKSIAEFVDNLFI